MSYDLMVFDPAFAPRERDAFLAWVRAQTTWSEGHSYDDPAIASPALQRWFSSAIATFPALNGPHATITADDSAADHLRTADYSMGQAVIHVAFSWTKAREAYDVVFSLAAQHGVGFFDVSSSMGEVWLPGAEGALALLHLDEEAERQQRRREALEIWVQSGQGDSRAWEGPSTRDPAAEQVAADHVEALRTALDRSGWRDGRHGSAAIWFQHALEILLSVSETAGAAPVLRAALLLGDKKAAGLRALRIGDEGICLYPRPSASRATGGDGYLLTGCEIRSPFSLSLGELTKALARVGHPCPAALGEALLTSAATAVLGRDTKFLEGSLVEFRTATKGVAALPHQVSLAEVRAVDPSAQPGEEYGFVSRWCAWLYPLLDWLYASQAAGGQVARRESSRAD